MTKDRIRLCMHCKEKPIEDSYDYFTKKENFKASQFFCSDECRILWNQTHPEDDTNLNDKEISGVVEKFCKKCNHQMKEFIIEGVSEFKCTYKKCGKNDT